MTSNDDVSRLEPSEVLTIAFLLDVIVFVASLAFGVDAPALAVAALALANVIALGYAVVEYTLAGEVVG